MELKQWIAGISSLFLLSACANNEAPTEMDAAAPDTALTPSRSDAVLNADTLLSTAGIETYLREQMPEWKVPEASEWEPYWFKRYNKGSNQVYRVQADFDGNTQTDYAYVLKSDKGQYAVWAFLKSDDSYSARKVYDITKFADKIHMGLDTLKSGSYDDLNSRGPLPAPVQTENPAIHVIFFETAARAYYWKDGGFHLIQTGD